jgi:hypothetical protein
MRPFSGSSPWLLALPMKGEIPSGGFLAVNLDSLFPSFPFPLNKVPLTKKLQVVVPIYRMMTNEKKILYTSCLFQREMVFPETKSRERFEEKQNYFTRKQTLSVLLYCIATNEKSTTVIQQLYFMTKTL